MNFRRFVAVMTASGLVLVESNIRGIRPDQDHGHSEQQEGPFKPSAPSAPITGGVGSVPFVDQSSMNAANMVAIRARHEFNAGAYRVAMTPCSSCHA